jgi:hypothetical protein
LQLWICTENSKTRQTTFNQIERAKANVGEQIPGTLEESARLRDENDYHRHGIATLRERHENLVRELRAAEERLFKIRPTSIAGAAALVAYVHAELVCCANAGFEGGPNWTLPALANAVVALRMIYASRPRRPVAA